MKKLLLIGFLGLVGISENMAQTCGTTISTFPHIQDFQTATVGAPGVLPTGWATSPATGFRFEIEDGQPTSGTTTGPSADHTTGNATTGKYVYTESSSGTTGAEAFLTSPCIDLTGLATPGFDFWYHMHGATTGTMEAQVSTNGGTTWTTLTTLTGAQQTANTDPWLKRTVSLAGYSGIVQIRFRGVRGTSFTSDMAIDDVKFYNIPANDLELVAITAPIASGCGFSANETVTVTVKNNGASATTSFPLSYQIGTNTPVQETANLVIAPGATATYSFTTKANLGTVGVYNFTATTLLPTDGDPSNNSKTKTVTVIPTVATFPYFQNFETGPGGWVAGGTASSWALGTPAGTVINSAGSGINSWKTTLSGTYNNNEQSAVVGPCFNFSTLVQPIITMKIWWNMENNFDKAALQSSIDGGATWQHVGAFGDPNNWYNNNSTSGPGVGGGVKVGWSGRNSTSNGSGGWVTAKHALNGLGGQSSVLLRVAFGTDGSGVDDGFAFDDVSVFESPANDVGIIALTSPVLGGCGFSATENVCITITNFGSAATTSFPVSYQIGTNPAVTENVTTPIAPGATATYCFTTKANLSAGGVYNFTFTTNQANDGDPSNNSITRTLTNPLISAFPHIQDFETSTAGSPGVLPSGWATSPTTGFRWEVETDQPSSGTTSGPNADHTTGVPGTGKYVYTESSSGVTGDSTFLTSPCINLAGLTSPGFDFWYHMHGATTGSILAQVSSNGGTTWTTLTTITGPQQLAHTDPWLKRTVSLAGYTGTIRLRFKGIRGTSFTSDMAVDDIKIYNIPSSDAEVTTITLPASGCNLTTAENICITVKNNSVGPISNVPVRYTINGGAPVNETVPGPIAPGATASYCFTTKANFNAAATYTVIGSVALTGDGDPSNNSKTGTVNSVPNISALPYSQGFENGNGGWVAGGVASSWALGTPAGTVINSAATGTNAWKTTLSGTYNNNEQSYVQSPCFNFSGKPDPDFEMMIWWNMENNFDKAALQSSIDGGATWQHVGAFGDPNNWYNNNSTSGPGVGGGVKVGWSGRASSSNGSNGWVKAKHKLTGLGGQSSVLLRIAFGTDGSGVDDGFAFDDIRIGDNTGNLAINSFVPLTQLCGFGANEKVEVVLENLGSTPVSGYTLSYTVNNGTTTTGPFTAPNVPTLQAGVPTNFIFPVGANLSQPGTYTIVVTVANPNDPEPANNTITYTIANASFPNIPQTFDFESAATGIAGMRVVTKPKSSVTENVAASRPLAGSPTTSTKGMVMEATSTQGWVMPVGLTDPWTNNLDFLSGVYICFNPQGAANPGLPLWMSFDLKQLFKTANANTNFRVTVNGAQIGATYRPPFAGTPIDWQKVYVDLSAYKNLPNIQVGLESSVAEPFANGAGTANLIDNIRFQRVNPTGITDKAFQSSINVYPNPSNGVFAVTVPTVKAFTLEVTDLTGKVVMRQAVKGSNQAQLDLHGNAQGVYLLKITSEGASAVQKIILE